MVAYFELLKDVVEFDLERRNGLATDDGTGLFFCLTLRNTMPSSSFKDLRPSLLETLSGRLGLALESALISCKELFFELIDLSTLTEKIQGTGRRISGRKTRGCHFINRCGLEKLASPTFVTDKAQSFEPTHQTAAAANPIR